MTFQQELSSWWSPSHPPIASPPKIGTQAPVSPQLQLSSQKPTVITFLRHCGCPFAEKTFLKLREAAKQHKDIDFIAVSHSDEKATQTWLKSLPDAGSKLSNCRVVVDDKLEIYAAWGLGTSSFAHVLDPRSLYSVWRMGKEGIWNRPTESGSRWQTAGTFVVDAGGEVRAGGPAGRADEIPDFEKAVRSLSDTKAQAKL